MKYTNIDKTELKPSNICLGIANIGVSYTEKEGNYLMDEFIDKGGNFIDTARVYSNWVKGEKSRSERILGDWLSERQNRNRLIISTKGGHPELQTMNISRLSKKEVVEDLDGSLKSLKTDYIDIYWLHRDDVNKPVSEIMDMLNGFEKEGKIRYYGCSNWTAKRIDEAMKYSEEMGYRGFIANQMMWNIGSNYINKLADPTLVKFDKETYSIHKKYNITAIPFSSQAGGFFSKLTSDDNEIINKCNKSDYYNARNIDFANKLKQYSKEFNMTVAELVLLYLMGQEINTIPIIGCRTIKQLRESLSVNNRDLAKEVVIDFVKKFNKAYE